MAALPRQGPPGEASRTGQVPYIVLVVASLVVLAVALAFRSTSRQRDESRFQNAIQATDDRIQNRLDTYVAVLLATRAMFVAHEDQFDAMHFRTFVTELDVQRRYPGIQGLGFTRAIAPSQRPALEEEMRRNGISDFRVWPDSARDEMHAIVMLEPLDQRNRAAIGYDMSTEPVRREAMSRARDTGLPVASGPVTLVQETQDEKQTGFLIYVPVYRGGGVPETVEERRALLAGFVYSPFRMADMLDGIFGSETEPRLAFALRDAGSSSRVMYQSGPSRPEAELRQTTPVEVAGRTWFLEFWSLEPFERGSTSWLWPYVVCTGILVTAILFALSLRQSRAAEQLRIHGQVLASMNEGVSVTDEAGVILYTNPAEDRMFGYDPGELLGQSVTVLNTYEPRENERIVHEVMRELRERGVWMGEFENVRKDGTQFVTSAHITALALSGGRFWVAVQQDVTERKQAELERADLLEREKSHRVEAEAASRTKDEFLAMLGHELRNPLAPIVTALSLLERRPELARTRELATIRRQVTHLARLVDDLLDVSAITRGKIKLEKSLVSVEGVVDAAIEVVRPLIDDRKHTLTVDLVPGLYVEGDHARLVQIVGNLLNNAAKYTSPGGHIAVRAAREDEQITIAVRDDGQGIAPDAIERLFGLFEQGERGLDRAQGGLGIGLALVRSLVQLHGGGVEAKSEGFGKGSEFIVRLPAAEAPAQGQQVPLVRGALREPSEMRRVLVVDDNVDAAEMLGELLRREGHEVTVSYDGEDALELAAAHVFDVAVLDIGLPKMDGFELASRLKTEPPPTLVAVTGYGRDVDRRSTKETGFDHHLVKPVDTAQLLGIIARAPVRPS